MKEQGDGDVEHPTISLRERERVAWKDNNNGIITLPRVLFMIDYQFTVAVIVSPQPRKEECFSKWRHLYPIARIAFVCHTLFLVNPISWVFPRYPVELIRNGTFIYIPDVSSTNKHSVGNAISHGEWRPYNAK